MVTVRELASRALKENYKVTRQEAIDLWLIDPNIFQIVRQPIDDYEEEFFNAKGLGEFEIIN